jgi:hypothetical protein
LKSIKSNIVAFAILATLIPSVGLGLMSFVGSQDVINKNVDYELSALAKDASSELTHWLRERVHDVRTLSTAYTLIDGLGAGPPRAGAVRIGTAELALYLSSVQKKLDPLLELTLTDAGGQIIASSAASPATVALPQAWQSASITSGVLVAPPRWDDARATPTVTVAVPVLSPRNELLGALAAVLDLKGFEPRLRSVAGSSTAELVLVATDGTPLLSTKASASALARLDPQAWTRLRGQSDEPLTYVDFQKHEVLGVAAPPGTLPIVVVAQRERRRGVRRVARPGQAVLDPGDRPHAARRRGGVLVGALDRHAAQHSHQPRPIASRRATCPLRCTTNQGRDRAPHARVQPDDRSACARRRRDRVRKRHAAAARTRSWKRSRRPTASRTLQPQEARRLPRACSSLASHRPHAIRTAHGLARQPQRHQHRLRAAGRVTTR